MGTTKKEINKEIVNLAIGTLEASWIGLLDLVKKTNEQREKLAVKLAEHEMKTVKLLWEIKNNDEYKKLQEERLDEYFKIDEGWKIAKEVYDYFFYKHKKFNSNSK